ncbi:MAG: inositol monophosphatase [Candidatus Kerfeldbacteria bacterium]|nr:inositol monophosphatase [Candidatus Kerfeldbacteria bacterium]
MHSQESLSQMSEIAREAGKILLEYKNRPLEKFHKGTQGDFATAADLAAQTYIVSEIQERFPDDGIIAEEENCSIPSRSGYTWVIDPIDGTRNYASGSEHFGVMIGRVNEKEITESVVYFPSDDVLFSAARHEGALRNGERVTPSFPASIQKVRACLAHTDPAAHTTPAMDALRSMLAATGFEPCSLFSSAANMRSILEGNHDTFVIPSNCAWDNCAPALLFEEAGFTVSDWKKGKIHPLFGTQHFLAAPPTVYDAIQKTLAAFYN